MTLQKAVQILFFAFVFYSYGSAQTNKELKNILLEFVSNSQEDIGISIVEKGTDKRISINGNKLYPMMSTFKVPIALTIFNKIEKGELSLQQEVFISKQELFVKTWSPFREKFPDGDIAISLEEALRYMVVESDNNITDILIRLAGGEATIENFIGNKKIHIQNNEADMHVSWDAQFLNRATPNAYTQLLISFTEGKILNEAHTKWLYQAMVESKTGTKRLKGKLPNVVIAQRAGTSFTNDEGIIGAINNVGIMELSENRKIYIAVFLHKTSLKFEKGEEMIADIAKIVYDHYSKQ